MIAFSVLTIGVRALPLSNNFALIVAVGAPYTVVAAAVTLALLALGRQLVIAGLATVVVAASLAIQLHWYYAGQPTMAGAHAAVRVLSSNLRKGRADVASFVALAHSSADVITLSELTPDWVRRFYNTGIRAEFPYSILVPAPGAGGFGLWSRFPLTVVSPLRGGSMIAALMRVPGVRADVVVASVHIPSPLAFEGRSFDDWKDGIEAAKVRMASLATISDKGSAIIAGDFNSTPDMRQFRDLLEDGYSDGVEQTGAGFAPTFPARRWLPPLITIDHVLTRRAPVSTIRTVVVPGSDHRALAATILVPVN